MNTDQHKTLRCFFRCLSCRKPWAQDIVIPESASWPNAYRYRLDEVVRSIVLAPCPLCRYERSINDLRWGRAHRFMGEVKGPRLTQPEDRCPCDRRCTNATGPNCECSCGGVNHGSGRLVSVDVDCGPVPQGVAS